jgi:hypothetical protein
MASSSSGSPSGIVPLPREHSLDEAVAAHHPQMSYAHTIAQGNSRNQYGNSYHTYNGSVYQHAGSHAPDRVADVPDQDALDIANLREALAFDTMDNRFATIRPAHGQTCQWLFERPEYKHWRDQSARFQHYGMLWVKGKPGTGKSTLMKCAYTHGSTTLHDEVIVAFFFNARGEELEKSAVGLYRSLPSQLLDQLMSRITHLFANVLALPSRRRRLKRRDWPIELLKDLFNDVVLALGSIKLTCYIDALDECPETSIRDLLDFLEDLGASTLEAGIAFSTMLSSRHYPSITVRHASEITLESLTGHHRDISEYVHDKLRIDDPRLARDFASKIESRSSGVFLWVVLVVAMLNRLHDRGHRHLLHDLLDKLPVGLHSLFQQAIQKGSYNRANVVDLLLWILYAKRPLALRECYHAVVIGEQGYSSEGWNPSEATEHDMTKFIIDTSRGLAETTRGDHPTVQFIHESVRDFLFADGLGLLEPGLASGGASNPKIIHALLYQCCSRHMFLYESWKLLSPTDGAKEHMVAISSTDVAAMRASLLSEFPFLDYALEGVLHHADSMLRLGHADSEHAHTFPYKIWIRLYNLRVHRWADRIGMDVSREYIFATQGCYYLLEEATRDESQVSRWDRRIRGRHTCLLHAAVDRNDQKMIDMLERHGATEG